MPKSILVASPHAAFSELLRLSLEEGGKYTVHVARSGKEALAIADQTALSLAILDCDLTDLTISYLGSTLLARFPGIRLMVIPPDNESGHSVISQVAVDAFLSRPFYLPDLLDQVNSLLEEGHLSLGGNGRLKGATIPDFSAESGSEPVGGTLPSEATKEEKGAPAASKVVDAPLGEKSFWLEDTESANKTLDRLLFQSSARSILVIRDGRILALTSHLALPVAEELVSLLERYWNRTRRSDLVRFVRLETDGKECLLYATALETSEPAQNLILLVVYDVQTPLSRCRNQTLQMARALSGQTPDESNVIPPIQAKQESSTGPSSTIISEKSNAITAGTPASSALAFSQPSAGQQVDWPAPEDFPAEADQPLEDELDEARAISLAELLEAMPPPDPQHAPSVNTGWLITPDTSDQSLVEPAPAAEREAAVIFPWEQTASAPEARGVPSSEREPEAEAAPQRDAGTSATGLEAEEGLPIAAEILAMVPDQGQQTERPRQEFSPETSVEEEKVQPAPELAVAEQETSAEVPLPAQPVGVQPLAEEPVEAQSAGQVEQEGSIRTGSSPEAQSAIMQTQPTRLRLQVQNEMEGNAFPVADTFLYYTCILIPRIPKHILTGALAECLVNWVPQICLAFGWFLERVVIRPEYLQWTVQVTPMVSPGNLVRIVRLRTSEYIFAEFPRLKKGNPVEDFWAPGYLVSSGSQPPSSNLLWDFIRETRLRQGFTKQ